jgi:hypothetical protein
MKAVTVPAQSSQSWPIDKENSMSEQIKREVEVAKDAPAKCAACPFLDAEHDPFSRATRFYCKAPWWDTKRWFCALPAEVARA